MRRMSISMEHETRYTICLLLLDGCWLPAYRNMLSFFVIIIIVVGAGSCERSLLRPLDRVWCAHFGRPLSLSFSLCCTHSTTMFGVYYNVYGWVGWLMSVFYDLCALDAHIHSRSHIGRQKHENEQTYRESAHRRCAHIQIRDKHIEVDSMHSLARSFVHFSFWLAFVLFESAFELFVGPCFAAMVSFFVVCRVTEREHTSYACSFFPSPPSSSSSSFPSSFHIISFHFIRAVVMRYSVYAREAHSIHCLCSTHSTTCSIMDAAAFFLSHFPHFSIPSMSNGSDVSLSFLFVSRYFFIFSSSSFSRIKIRL